MDDKPKRRPWTATVAVLGMILVPVVAAMGLYFGLYLLILEGKIYRPTGADPITKQNLYHIEPKYRESSESFSFMFEPAHRFDRRLRTEHWATIEHSSGTSWKNPVKR